jgi:hypothetical protein
MTEIKTHSSYIPLERKVKLIDWQGYIKAKLKELRLGNELYKTVSNN